MKKLLALVAALLVALALYLWLKPHKQDPHYFAAACVVLNDMSPPENEQDFMAKLNTVIINENSSYAVKKVTFDKASAHSASQRYAALSEQDKARAKQGVAQCLPLLMGETDAQ